MAKQFCMHFELYHSACLTNIVQDANLIGSGVSNLIGQGDQTIPCFIAENQLHNVCLAAKGQNIGYV